MQTKIKTIDINAKEWLDRVNGNSYFSGTVTVNFGMKGEQTFIMPFQYGYGDHYKDMAFQELEKSFPLTDVIKYENGANEGLRGYADRFKIIVRAHIQHNCKKKELSR